MTKHPGIGILIVLLGLGALVLSEARAFPGDIVLSGGGDKAFLERMEIRLGKVVSMLEAGEIAPIEAEFNAEGLSAMAALLASVAMENSRPVHESHLITLRDGDYEVRGIRVRVEMGETDGSAYQYLVFRLDQAGRIADVRFSVEADHYERIIDDHVDLTDLARRQRILQFVEIYRTAHNRKDIEYLERVYSDNALIIVGQLIEKQPGHTDMLDTSFRSDSEIRLVKKSKQEYIASLARVFARNDFVKVGFEKIEIVRHHKDKDLYGVTLQQHWTSSHYSDSGWLFLMVDFRDQDDPLIHVRSWQPQPFADNTVMGLYDFELIE